MLEPIAAAYMSICGFVAFLKLPRQCSEGTWHLPLLPEHLPSYAHTRAWTENLPPLSPVQYSPPLLIFDSVLVVLIVTDINILTIVNSRNILPPAVDKFVAWSISIQDSSEGLLVNITHSWCQTCGWRHTPQQMVHVDCRAGYACSLHTEYCIPSVGVASEVEHVRVIGSNYGQSVMDAGHEVCPADGSVHFHSFIQSLLGLAFMVSMINTPPWHRTEYVLALWHHSYKANNGHPWHYWMNV